MAEDATPSATAGALDPSETRQLLDLPSDLLQQVLTQLVHDELSLLRMGATCKTLSELASAADLWRPGLTRFFDGEVPPALATCADPQRELREQVLCAQRLAAKERKARSFQVVDVDFPNIRAWMQALDDRVAEAQMKLGGVRYASARPGRPYYGCSGGAYNCTTLAYGNYVKGVMCNGSASRHEGISADEARLTVWLLAHADVARRDGQRKRQRYKAKGRRLRQGKGRDSGRACSAQVSGGGAHRALGVRLRADGRVEGSQAGRAGGASGPQAAGRALREGALEGRACRRTVPVFAGQGCEHRQGTADPRPERPRSAQAAGRPLRRAFGLEEIATSIGMIYALACPADGSNIVDYSGM